MKINCHVYRSRPLVGAYVYLAEGREPDELPEPLRKKLEPLEHSMDLELWPDRPLARVKSTEVIASLESSGFFIQMPPPPDDEMMRTNERMTKLEQHF